MRLLVIGHSGQIARSLFEKKSNVDGSLVTIGRPGLDLEDAASVQRSIEENSPDIVINAAAYTAVDKAEEENRLAYSINRDGPAVLARECNMRDIPLIHISTDYVFDGTKFDYYTEDDRVAPLGVYGKSKLEGELAVASACNKYIILRTSWIYSPFGNNFVKTMLRLAKTHNELNVVDDQIGCPTYAPHIAAAILQIVQLMDGFENWGIYNIAGSGETSWCGFAREIFACSSSVGGPVARVNAIMSSQYPTPAQRPANSRLDCEKLRKTFDISMPDWRVGTMECVSRLGVW